LSCGPRLTGELTVVTNAGLANRHRPARISRGPSGRVPGAAAGPRCRGRCPGAAAGAPAPRPHRWYPSAAGWNCIPWLQSFAMYPAAEWVA